MFAFCQSQPNNIMITLCNRSRTLLCILFLVYGVTGCHALQITQLNTSYGHRRPVMSLSKSSSCWRALYQQRRSIRPLSVSASKVSNGPNNSSDGYEDDDEALLQSIDPSTLQNLCKQYSLSTSGTKQDMLQRLRDFATEQAELDKQRNRSRTQRVEANLEGKARHTIMEQEAFALQEDADDDDEMQGYFYYEAAEAEEEKKQREEQQRKEKQKQQLAARKSQTHLTAPPPPEDVKVNEKGERVVTVYSTTDKNDLTGMTSSTPMSDMSMENARYQQKKSISASNPEESLVGGPFGDTSRSKRKKADASQLEKAKESITELVRNLLATTGAPAFQDDYEDGDDTPNEFSAPYGFVGFDPERIPPNLLSESSFVLRTDNGRALNEVLSEYELQAIGHDGMAADDRSEGGGHYREVEKVGSFLQGYRKAEERRVARETSSMLLQRLVKEGVKGLDQLLAGMVREGDDNSMTSSEGGELNSALVRYLEEAVREQEQRAKKTVKLNDNDNAQGSSDGKKDDDMDLMWNVTRGEDGTTIETIDPNTPIVKQMLREELEKTKDSAGVMVDTLMSMTVQEKMLLLLKLLRDRIKVEAVIGNDEHARNLRILAYCLKAANDDERHQLILDELGNSLDVSSECLYLLMIYICVLYVFILMRNSLTQALDIFSDLLTSSIDFAEARQNDDFMPGNEQQQKASSISPVLDISKLQKIKIIVERIKSTQTWKASGISNQ